MSKNTNNNQTVDEKKGKRTGLTILGYVLVIVALRDGNGVSYKVVKGQVIAKTPFIGYLSQLCFSAVGIIVTVVIFAAGVAIMMYVNKISKEINTMVEQQTA